MQADGEGGGGGWKHVPIRSAIKIEGGGMSKLKDTLRFAQPVCYFKTRIKYDYCTVRNAHLSLIGNLSNCSGRKSTKIFGGKIREIFTLQSQKRRPRVRSSVNTEERLLAYFLLGVHQIAVGSRYL